jgi:hypothetical protein
MAEVTMKFNVPEDNDELKLAQRGGDFYCTILEIQNLIRSHEKYESPKTAEELVEAIKEAVYEAKTDDIS